MKYLLIIYFVLTSINLCAQNKIYGSFVGKDTFRELQLKEDNTYYIINKKNKYVYQQDTLSYGHWKIKDGFVVINSSEKISDFELPIVVEESKNPTDTLKILITNPYEMDFHKNNNRFRYFNYYLSLNTSNEEYNDLIKLDTNQLILNIKENAHIFSFYILIVADVINFPSDIAFNYLTTKSYKLNHFKSNHFKINIPDFTLDYIGYTRYKEEYIKVLSKNRIQLRGEIFEKN